MRTNTKQKGSGRACGRLEASVHDETMNHLHPGPKSYDCRSLLKAGEIALHANLKPCAGGLCRHLAAFLATDQKVFRRSPSCLLALSLLAATTK